MRNINLGKIIHYLFGALGGLQKINAKCGTLLDCENLNQDSNV